jgi:long-subunit acyl-CoA synthetase (AMP-forming)
VSRTRNHLLEFGQPVPMSVAVQFAIADKLVFKGIRDKLGGNLVIMGSGIRFHIHSINNI